MPSGVPGIQIEEESFAQPELPLSGINRGEDSPSGSLENHA